jgi:Flp pilus assembly protein TadD
MKLLAPIAAALLLSGCAATQPGGGSTEAVNRQLRIAGAAERTGNLDMALQVYATAFEANKGDPELAARFARALLQAGNAEPARDVLAEARRRNPRDSQLMQTEARVLLEVGQPEQALALFDEHLRWSSRDARSLNGRGIALDMLGRHVEARAAYRAARAADPQSAVASGNLALSLMLTGCTEGAAAVAESAPRAVATSAWISQIRSASPGFAGLRGSTGEDPCAGAG